MNKNSGIKSDLKEHKRFKTNNGHCYVLDDSIVITNKRKVTIDDALAMSWRLRVMMGIFGICGSASLLYSYFEFFSDDHLFFCMLHLIIAAIFGYLIYLEVRKSSVKIIRRQDIISAGYYGARFGRTRSVFEIMYYRKGIAKSFEIQMPINETPRNSNTQKALGIMHEVLD